MSILLEETFSKKGLKYKHNNKEAKYLFDKNGSFKRMQGKQYGKWYIIEDETYIKLFVMEFLNDSSEYFIKKWGNETKVYFRIPLQYGDNISITSLQTGYENKKEVTIRIE